MFSSFSSIILLLPVLFFLLGSSVSANSVLVKRQASPVGIGSNDPPPVNLNEPIGELHHEQIDEENNNKQNGGMDMVYDTVEEQQPSSTMKTEGAAGKSQVPEGTTTPKMVTKTETGKKEEGGGGTRTTMGPKGKEDKEREKDGLKGKKTPGGKAAKGAAGAGTETTPQGAAQRNCNSEQMRKLIIENIHAKPSIAKRQIQAKVAAEINGKIDVICAKHAFSYIVNSELFCEAESNGVICLCFKQQG